MTGGPSLSAATSYWLVLASTGAQTSGNYWKWQSSTSSNSSYADGNAAQYATSWTAYAQYDLQCSITTQDPTVTKLAQSFQLTSDTVVNVVQAYLKKVSTPTGTLNLRIETNNSGAPSGTLVNASATATLAEASLTTSYALTGFTFPAPVSLAKTTTYWLVLSTSRAPSTAYVKWGVDSSTPSYATGQVAKYIASWATASEDAVFEIVPADKIFYDEA